MYVTYLFEPKKSKHLPLPEFESNNLDLKNEAQKYTKQKEKSTKLSNHNGVKNLLGTA